MVKELVLASITGFGAVAIWAIFGFASTLKTHWERKGSFD